MVSLNVINSKEKVANLTLTAVYRYNSIEGETLLLIKEQLKRIGIDL